MTANQEQRTVATLKLFLNMKLPLLWWNLYVKWVIVLFVKPRGYFKWVEYQADISNKAVFKIPER